MKKSESRYGYIPSGLWPVKEAILCPFHAENTPSCVLEDGRPDDVKGKGSWHCFSCGASGDYWINGEHTEKGQRVRLRILGNYPANA